MRSRVLAIPQDPFFFPDGQSYQANLDPYDNASESECELVLKDVELWTMIQTRGGLNACVTAASLSQGQKQLFCVARTVLRARARSRAPTLSTFQDDDGASSKHGGILLLDEVTSSVDKTTEDLIRRIIRKEFEAYTVISVVHREDTLQDYDRMLVMENGKIKEDRNLRGQ